MQALPFRGHSSVSGQAQRALWRIHGTPFPASPCRCCEKLSCDNYIKQLLIKATRSVRCDYAYHLEGSMSWMIGSFALTLTLTLLGDSLPPVNFFLPPPLTSLLVRDPYLLPPSAPALEGRLGVWCKVCSLISFGCARWDKFSTRLLAAIVCIYFSYHSNGWVSGSRAYVCTCALAILKCQ